MSCEPRQPSTILRKRIERYTLGVYENRMVVMDVAATAARAICHPYCWIQEAYATHVDNTGSQARSFGRFLELC